MAANMKIDKKTFDQMPKELQALFIKLPNHSRAEVVAGFPANAGGHSTKTDKVYSYIGDNPTWKPLARTPTWHKDTGSAARFFYCAKASKADRDEGLEGFDFRQTIGGGGTNDPNGDDVCGKYGSVKSLSRNHHPTVKPTSLMKYLCRLVTPPGGLVLDPFMGSGSTGKAAILEGFRFVGIEREAEYLEIARARINHVAGVKNEPEEPESKQSAISKPQQAKLF